MSLRQKSTDYGHSFQTRARFPLLGVSQTNSIKECALLYETLLNKRFTVLLKNGISFSFNFTPGAFYHILGLEKLNGLYEFNNKSKNLVYKEIKSGNIPASKIENHRNYRKIENRIKYFDRIVGLLNKEHSKLIIEFDPSIVGNTKLLNTKYMFYAHERSGYTHFTVAQKEGMFYPETFFYENSKRYISEQEIVEVKNIIIVNINNQ